MFLTLVGNVIVECIKIFVISSNHFKLPKMEIINYLYVYVCVCMFVCVSRCMFTVKSLFSWRGVHITSQWIMGMWTLSVGFKWERHSL